MICTLQDQSACPANQHLKSTIKKKRKPTYLCAPHEVLKTFHMFLLFDLQFVLCSRDLDVLRTQRIMAFLFLIYLQISEVRKSDNMTTQTKSGFHNMHKPTQDLVHRAMTHSYLKIQMFLLLTPQH